RQNPRGTDPGVWQLLDGADPRDRAQWLEVIHSGDSVLVQHDGEDILAQRRRTVTGGAITGMSSVVGMTVDVVQQLGLRAGMRCLELGTGTGVAAGLLRHLVGPGGCVVSMEGDRHLAAAAGRRLAAAGLDVEVVTGDGLAGHPPGAPFDRVVATFAVPRLPDAWLEQLADDGVLWTSLATASPSWPGTVVARRCGRRVTARLAGAQSGHRPVAGFEWLSLRGYRELRAQAPREVTRSVPAVPGEEERGFWLAVPHLVPGVVRNLDAENLTLVAPRDGSWMVARPDGAGRAEIEAGGPRQLWAELEQVRLRWVRAGRPAAFSVEIDEGGEQHVHAGHGSDRLSWTLPAPAAQTTAVGGAL
ncbi:MAG: methyltransferase, partial [Streptomyces sp.]|nr:methyltransferase [Streptomyces sp.]